MTVVISMMKAAAAHSSQGAVLRKPKPKRETISHAAASTSAIRAAPSSVSIRRKWGGEVPAERCPFVARDIITVGAPPRSQTRLAGNEGELALPPRMAPLDSIQRRQTVSARGPAVTAATIFFLPAAAA